MNNAVIADDSHSIRLLLRKILEGLGFNVIAEAENGEEAINIIKSNKVDLLLLDINMPIITGLEALDPILDESPDTIVIVMTSVTEKDMVDKCLNLGAANYIVKDSDWAKTKKTIMETWDLNKLD